MECDLQDLQGRQSNETISLYFGNRVPLQFSANTRITAQNIVSERLLSVLLLLFK